MVEEEYNELPASRQAFNRAPVAFAQEEYSALPPPRAASISAPMAFEQEEYSALPPPRAAPVAVSSEGAYGDTALSNHFVTASQPVSSLQDRMPAASSIQTEDELYGNSEADMRAGQLAAARALHERASFAAPPPVPDTPRPRFNSRAPASLPASSSHHAAPLPPPPMAGGGYPSEPIYSNSDDEDEHIYSSGDEPLKRSAPTAAPDAGDMYGIDLSLPSPPVQEGALDAVYGNSDVGLHMMQASAGMAPPVQDSNQLRVDAEYDVSEGTVDDLVLHQFGFGASLGQGVPPPLPDDDEFDYGDTPAPPTAVNYEDAPTPVGRSQMPPDGQEVYEDLDSHTNGAPVVVGVQQDLYEEIDLSAAARPPPVASRASDSEGGFGWEVAEAAGTSTDVDDLVRDLLDDNELEADDGLLSTQQALLAAGGLRWKSF